MERKKKKAFWSSFQILIIFLTISSKYWRSQISTTVLDGRKSGVHLGASKVVEGMSKVLIDDH